MTPDAVVCVEKPIRKTTCDLGNAQAVGKAPGACQLRRARLQPRQVGAQVHRGKCAEAAAHETAAETAASRCVDCVRGQSDERCAAACQQRWWQGQSRLQAVAVGLPREEAAQQQDDERARGACGKCDWDLNCYAMSC